MSYDIIEFPFQVHNDAQVTETAYLCPENLPWGATLEVTPRQADIAPGTAALFNCKLTLDPAIIRPGCSNDQGFRLTAWRVADDADQRWGSCFYFLRPRVRTRLDVVRTSWYETRLSVHGQLKLDSDQPARLADHLPLGVRVRLEFRQDGKTVARWAKVQVQPGGMFHLQLTAFDGPPGADLAIQAWFDRTDLLSSSRSELVTCRHEVAPVIH